MTVFSVDVDQLQRLEERFSVSITTLFPNRIAIEKAIHEAEEGLRKTPDRALAEAVAEARGLASRVPVDSQAADDPAFTSMFTRGKRGFPLPAQQAEIEEQWNRSARRDHKGAAYIQCDEIVVEDDPIRQGVLRSCQVAVRTAIAEDANELDVIGRRAVRVQDVDRLQGHVDFAERVG